MDKSLQEAQQESKRRENEVAAMIAPAAMSLMRSSPKRMRTTQAANSPTSGS